MLCLDGTVCIEIYIYGGLQLFIRPYIVTLNPFHTVLRALALTEAKNKRFEKLEALFHDSTI
jgi:hypothetical protein